MAVRADDVDLVRDRSLVELCQAGDEAAFGDLYVRYYQRLLRFCVRRVGNPHDAEEITQEAFARAFSAMPRFAGERRFYPWLTVIAARLCIDSHRRVARAEPTAEVDPGLVDGGQQQIIDNVDLTYLAKAMERLGPRHREVLALRETHRWSYQQIADHYDVTMGTVEALLFRARKALRREFMAVSGGDRRLIGLPFLGVMWRVAANVRARLNELGSQLAPAAAAGALSIAALASGFGAAPSVGNPRPVTGRSVSLVVANPTSTSASGPAAAIGTAAGDVSDTVNELVKQPAEVGKGTAADGRQRAGNDSAVLNVAGVVISADAAGLPLVGQR